MSEAPMTHERKLEWIDTDKIINNDQNPRAEEEFTPESLESLRSSIRTHGVFQPVIVSPYSKGQYRLIEGERRATSAKLEGIKELPAVIVNKMDPKDEVITMFNIHTQFKGWQVADELRAIQEIREKNGHMTDADLAKQLGMELATYKDRLRVLQMGPEVMRDIATNKLGFTAALRSDEVATMIAKKRPTLVDKLGGTKQVKNRLLAKAKARKRGISQELVQFRHELGDTARIPDKVVEQYLQAPEVGFRDILNRNKDAQEVHTIDELASKVNQLARELRSFSPRGMSVDNLKKLRRGLDEMLQAGEELATKISDAMAKSER
jgi:ParB family chromosome partitioning protein